MLGATVHSTVSWKLSTVPLKYDSNTTMPVDAYMWEKVRSLGVDTLLCPKITVCKEEDGVR